MPATHLVDPGALDLDRIVVPREELGNYLLQRNRFAMLDRVVYEDLEAGLVVGVKEIRGDDWWAADHVPGRPMFPGALQVETAAQLAAYDYTAHRVRATATTIPEGKFVGFGGLEKVRFRDLVIPDCRLAIAVRLEKQSRRMFRYEAQGFVGPKLVFEGTIIGVLV